MCVLVFSLQTLMFLKFCSHRDNAGSDVVLGMLPLAREFLKCGSQVVIAANRLPTINDITAGELQELLESVKTRDMIIR